jgi:tripartite-type tricarboxylate transporter receptor subunit TctC
MRLRRPKPARHLIAVVFAVVIAVVLGHVLLGSFASRANAQSVEDFYRGRSVKLTVAAAVAGGADLYARVLAPHLGKHIPGHPSFVIQNTPGAAGLLVARQLQGSAPGDGSVVTLLQRNNLLEPLLADRDVGFDPRKVIWLGSLNKDTYLIFSWHTAGVRTIEDAKKKELILGNTGGGNENVTFPLLLNQTIGTKFRLVRGYKGSGDLSIAIERGEVQGRAITLTTLRADHPDWLSEKKVDVIVQLALKRSLDLPDIPSAMEYVNDEKDRRLYQLLFATLEAGRPFAVAQGTPPERVAALRTAFAELPQDREFLEDLRQRGGSVEYITGEDVEQLISSIYATPRDVIDRARALVAEH